MNGGIEHFEMMNLIAPDFPKVIVHSPGHSADSGQINSESDPLWANCIEALGPRKGSQIGARAWLQSHLIDPAENNFCIGVGPTIIGLANIQ